MLNKRKPVVKESNIINIKADDCKEVNLGGPCDGNTVISLAFAFPLFQSENLKEDVSNQQL